MDTITCSCDQCGGRFRVGAEYHGKKIRCPKCKAAIAVVDESASIEERRSPHPPVAPTPKSGPEEDSRPERGRRPRRPVDEDDDDRPQRRRASVGEDQDSPRRSRQHAPDGASNESGRRGSKRSDSAAPDRKRGLDAVGALVALLIIGFGGAIAASYLGLFDPELQRPNFAQNIPPKQRVDRPPVRVPLRQPKQPNGIPSNPRTDPLAKPTVNPVPVGKPAEFKGEVKIEVHPLKTTEGTLYMVEADGVGWRPVLNLQPGFLQNGRWDFDRPFHSEFHFTAGKNPPKLVVLPGLPNNNNEQDTLAYTVKIREAEFEKKPLLDIATELTGKDPTYQQRGSHFKRFPLDMKKGQMYVIDLEGKDASPVDTYLILEDDRNQFVGSDDDGGVARNSRLVYVPYQTGKFHIVATTLDRGDTGKIQLRARVAKATASTKIQELTGKVHYGLHAMPMSKGALYNIRVTGEDWQPPIGIRPGFLGFPPFDFNQPQNNATDAFFVPVDSNTYYLNVVPDYLLPSYLRQKLTYRLDVTPVSMNQKPILEVEDEFTAKDQLYRDRQAYYKAYDIKMKANHYYLIDLMQNGDFLDAYLYLEDDKNKILQTNDDGGEGLNSRLAYRPQREGTYRIIASTLGRRQKGRFKLQVREQGDAGGQIAVKKPAPKRDLAELIKSLKSPDIEQRLVAMSGIAGLKTAGHKAMPELMEALSDGDEAVRAEARNTIIAVGERPLSAVVDFGASWCGPCRTMKPIVTRLIKEGLPIWEIDVDERPDVSAKFNIRFVPCYVLFKDGMEIDRINGITSEDGLREMAKRVEVDNGKRIAFGLAGTAQQAQFMALLLGVSADDSWQRARAEAALRTSTDVIAPLLVGVVDGNYPASIRLGAVRALAKLPKETAVPGDLRSLFVGLATNGDESVSMRGVAALALSDRAGTEDEVVAPLTALLSDAALPYLQVDAAEALGKRRTKKAVPQLVAAVQGGARSLQKAALGALREIGSDASEALPALIRLYQDEFEQRNNIRPVLEQIVPAAKNAVPILLDSLKSDDEEVRRLAVQLLRSVGDPEIAKGPLSKALADDDVEVRIEAAIILERLGQRSPAVVDALLASVGKERRNYDASEALRRMGHRAAPKLAALLTKEEQNQMVRQQAGDILQQIGERAKDVLPILEKALASKDDDVQLASALVLSRLTPKNKLLVAPLTKGLASKDSNLRGQCVYALARTRSEIAVPALLEAMKDRDKNFQFSIGNSLRSVPMQKDAIDTLKQMVQNAETRLPAAMALAPRVKDHPDVLPVVVEVFKLCSDRDRSQLIYAFDFADKATAQAMLDIFESKDSGDQVKIDALRTLCAREFLGEGVVKKLEQQLKTADNKFKPFIAIALAREEFKVEFVPALIQALKSDANESDLALDMIDQIGAKAAPAVDALMLLADDANERTRELAIHALGNIGTDKAAGKLVSMLTPAMKESIRSSIVGSLQNMGDRAVPKLKNALENKNLVKQDVVKALGYIGGIQCKEVVPILLEELNSKDRQLAHRCAIALSTIDPTHAEAVDVLVEMARTQNNRGYEALQAIGRFKSHARNAVPFLRAALHDRQLRNAALHALVLIGDDAGAAVDDIANLVLSDQSYNALRALAAMGPKAKPAVPKLLVAMNNTNSTTLASDALCAIGTAEGEQAIAILVEQLGDVDMRSAACRSLSSMRDKKELAKALGQARGPLTRLAFDPDAIYRVSAMRTLGSLQFEESIPALAGALEDDSVPIRCAATYALGDMGVKAAPELPKLLILAKADDKDCVRAALYAISNFKEYAKPAVPLLIEALDDKMTEQAAVEAISRLGPVAAEAGVPALIKLLDRPESRISAAVALSKFGADARTALPRLEELLEQETLDYNRHTLRDTISKIREAKKEK